MTASKTIGPEENIMGTMPVGNLLMKMSVPVILSMLVSTLYNVVDDCDVFLTCRNSLYGLVRLCNNRDSCGSTGTAVYACGMEKDDTATARSKIKIRRKAT